MSKKGNGHDDKEVSVQPELGQPTEEQEVGEAHRVLENALRFLDRPAARPSAIGHAGRHECQQYQLCIGLLEAINRGEFLVVRAAAIKPTLAKKLNLPA